MRSHIKKLSGLLVGVAVGGGIISYIDDHKWWFKIFPVVKASWTTNYTPSTKWDWNWDKLEPEALIHPKKLKSTGQVGPAVENEFNELIDKVKPKVSRNLFFVRHGQYNLEGKTDEESYLTPLGREQAQITGERLKALGHPYSVIMKSTMLRAKETADIISECLPDLPVKSCPLLREGAPIPPEPPVGHWRPEKRQFFVDGARIEASFRKYIHRVDPTEERDTYEIFVCHANVIRYFVCRSLQLPPEAWLRLSLHNASITWITIRPDGRVVLKQLGESGHLPPDKLTTS